MKNIWFIILILGILLGCRNSNKKSSSILLNENHKTFNSKLDSIKLGNGGYLIFDDTTDFASFLSKECRKRNPLENSIKLHSLGDIYEKDTLKLSAEFCQCGEFGGNKEYIIVYRNKKSLECQIITDSVVCHHEQEPAKYYRIFAAKYKINQKSAEAIVNYLELLLRYSIRDKDMKTAASSNFNATIYNSAFNRETLKIELFDNEGIWVEFDLLKSIIKTSANKENRI